MEGTIDNVHSQTWFGLNHVPGQRVQLRRPLIRKVARGAQLVQGVAVGGAGQDHQWAGDVGVGSVGAEMRQMKKS